MRDDEGSKNSANSGDDTEKQEAARSGDFGGWLKKKLSFLYVRFEDFQTWWQKTKAESEAKHDKKVAQDTSTAPPKVEPAFARAAGLVLWAPTAVLLAPIGAALITVFVVWLVRPTYVDNGKVISVASFDPVL